MIHALSPRSGARILLVLLVSALCALGAPAARAARPGTLIGSGAVPNVAVDADGTGYVVWNDELPGQLDEPVGLCVIPHGSSHCAAKRDVIIDGESGEAQPPLILATGHGQLAIAANRCCTVGDVETLSGDGGATFTTPAVIGNMIYFYGAIGPARQVLFVNDNGVNGVTSELGSIGAPADDPATLINPTPGLNAPTGWAGNRPVVVASGTETTAAIYSGSGDLNDSANWRNVRVPGSTFEPSVASGPHGLYLLQDTGVDQKRLTVRKFDGHGFGRAHVVVKTEFTEGTALAEDAAGRLVAAWYESGRMLAAASRDGGVHWTRAHVIATDVSSPDLMQAALGPDGRGWLVYGDDVPGQVRAVSINARALLGTRRPPRRRHRHPKPRPGHHLVRPAS